MTTLSDVFWTERYRPDTLDEVIGNESIVESMEEWSMSGELPNILLSGPAGVGKTAIATAWAKDFYGDDWQGNFMEMNASDDRGIDIVREEIKSYAEQGTTGQYPFKVIFLDEADSLTKDAQSALRRVMEDYAGDTRFIMSCNFVGKLIDPIQSRCTMFRVQPLSDAQVKQILQRVVEGEGLETDGNVLDLIIEHVGGDARKAINTLQAAVTGDRVSVASMEGVVSAIDGDDLEEIVREAIGGNLEEARERLNEDYLKEGVESGELASSMMKAVDNIDMNEQARCMCFDNIGEAEFRCIEGANPHVQWAACLANLQLSRHFSYESYE